MMKKVILYTALIFSAALLIAAENTVAVIKAFEGEVEILKDGQRIVPRVYLTLAPGTTVRVNNSAAYITLFLYTGEKKTFQAEAFLEITPTGLKGLDRITSDYLAQGESETVYSRKDVLSSRGYDPELTGEIETIITAIEQEVTDPLLQALLKGDVYKSYELKKLARTEFLKHKELLEKPAETPAAP